MHDGSAALNTAAISVESVLEWRQNYGHLNLSPQITSLAVNTAALMWRNFRPKITSAAVNTTNVTQSRVRRSPDGATKSYIKPKHCP